MRGKMIGVLTLFLTMVTGSQLMAADTKQLELGFYADAKALNLRSSQDGEQTSRSSVTEGEVISADEIAARMTSAPADQKKNSLFENSDLLVRLNSSDGMIAHERKISRCNHLDIYTVPENTFAERADCDGNIYEYSVQAQGIAIIRNKQQVDVLALNPGIYVLNGIPIRIPAD